MINELLDKSILEILEQGSLSEYELINTLQRPPYEIFSTDIFKSELALFQAHFVIHNALYRLRDFGLAQSLFDIDTLTTQITMLKVGHSNETSICEQSRPEIIKLREYYLDWRNFHKTQSEDVSLLLNSFWQSYSKMDIHLDDNNQVNLALQAFNFEKMPTGKELKSRYKQLSQRYHPDKGGSNQAFHSLYEHYQTLTLVLKNKKSFGN